MAHALIVEDESEIRRKLVSQVKAQGHTFVEASGLEEARQALDEHEFEFILLDLKIPFEDGDPVLESNGETFIQDVRDHLTNRCAGIIIVTSIHDPVTAVGCMKQGADDYMPKNLEGDRTKLKDCVQTALSERQARIDAKSGPGPKNLESGTLRFTGECIMLDDILLCSTMETNQAKVLHSLATWKDPDIPHPLGKHLADAAGLNGVNQVGEGAVTRAIGSVRGKLKKELQKRGVVLREDDFIVNNRGGAGYSFAPGIKIEFTAAQPPTGAVKRARKVARKKNP